MGSLPCEYNDRPVEKSAEIDKGNAPHEDAAHVQGEYGKTPHEEEAKVEGDTEDKVEGEVAARARELTGAEDSEADLAENSKLVKLAFFPFLGLLGLITATSPKLLCTLGVCPSAPTFLANAANLLWVAIGAGVAATGRISDEITSEDMLRVCCVRLLTPPASH